MKKTALLLGIMIVLAGCVKDIQNPDNSLTDISESGKKAITITANVADEEDTKATVNTSTGAHTWSEDDTIAVLSTEEYQPFTFVSDKQFCGTIEGNPAVALYPASFFSSANMSGSTPTSLNITIPRTIEDYVPGQTNVVMVGTFKQKVDDNYTFNFYHVAALMKFTVENVPFGTAYVELTTDKQITGTWENITAESTLEVKNGDTGKSIMLALAYPIVDSESKDFFFPIPTGTYNKFTLAFYDAETEEIISKTVNYAVTIDKKDLITTPTLTLPEYQSISLSDSFVKDGGYTESDFTFETAKNKGTTAPAYNKEGDVRIYANGSLTVSSTKKDITCIVFKISSQGKKRLATISASTGSIYTQSNGDEYVIWTADTSETGQVTFTVGDKAEYGSEGSKKAGQLCFDQLYARGINTTRTKYNIIYDANKPTEATGDVTGMPDTDQSVNGTFTLSDVEPKLDNYSFIGWGATSDATTTIKDVTINNGDVTVYAIWKNNDVVTTGTVYEINTDNMETGDDNAYASSGNNISITDNGLTIDWQVTGNNTMKPWRIGGKSITEENRDVYTCTPIQKPVDKITLTLGAASSITINSITLRVSQNSNFSDCIDYVVPKAASSSNVVTIAKAQNAYYKFVFNVTVSSGSNKFVELSGIKFEFENN